MNRTKTFRMAVVLALIAGPLAALLATAVYAQGGLSSLQGTVYDMEGKPFVGITLTIKNTENNKTIDVKTDGKGHYSAAGLQGGTYDIDVKQKEQVIYQTGTRISVASAPVFDINLKEAMEKEKGANAEAEKARAEQQKQFNDMKAHYDAGTAAIEQMKAAQAQLVTTPKDQQDPVKQKITEAGGTAVTELSAALDLMKPEESNRSIVLSRLGEAYESMSKWQEAADTYQKSIALKPDVAANYNNLGNDLAKLGKIDDARAAYTKYVELKPDDAALAWRNSESLCIRPIA
jgi:tetratricopeptide (TPR) repeat protein